MLYLCSSNPLSVQKTLYLCSSNTLSVQDARMDNLIKDLLGRAAYAEWFWSQSYSVCSAFQDETEVELKLWVPVWVRVTNRWVGLHLTVTLKSNWTNCWCWQSGTTIQITFPQTHFAAPRSEEEIFQMHQNAHPQKKKTKKKQTRHCLLPLSGMLGLLVEMKTQSNWQNTTTASDNDLQTSVLDYVICLWKKNGTEYPPNSLRHMWVVSCTTFVKMGDTPLIFSKMLNLQAFGNTWRWKEEAKISMTRFKPQTSWASIWRGCREAMAGQGLSAWQWFHLKLAACDCEFTFCSLVSRPPYVGACQQASEFKLL